jgi:hypothetical protein
MDTMGADDMDPDADPDMEPVDDEMDDALDTVGTDDDDFGASDAEAGGEDLGGREKRESVERPKKKLK